MNGVIHKICQLVKPNLTLVNLSNSGFLSILFIPPQYQQTWGGGGKTGF